MIMEYMNIERVSPKTSALLVAMPILGPFFFLVPWEVDPRAEKPEKRLERLHDRRTSFLVGFVAGIYNVGKSEENLWTGRFHWHELEREELQRTLDFRQDRLPLELERATRKRDAGQVKALLEKGADPNALTSEGDPLLKVLISQCAYVAAKRAADDCLYHCEGEYSKLAEARVSDAGLREVFNALVSAGAKADVILSQDNVTWWKNETRSSITVSRYAEMRCHPSAIEALRKNH